MMVTRQLVSARSQGLSYIKLGKVKVNGLVVTKPGFLVGPDADIELGVTEQYVSRAGLKLASVVDYFSVDFRDKVILDIGSSTGGFTDYSLKNGAKLVHAIDVGTYQLHPNLRLNNKIILRERTDIRDIKTLNPKPNIVLADVSFISLRDILPHVNKIINKQADLLVMVKPQFESDKSSVKHKGVVKNEAVRRHILRDFELWAKQYFFIANKKDSEVAGQKGNKERFYHLKPL